MSGTIDLSPTLISQLQQQSTVLGLPINELAERLIYQSLSQLEFSKQLWKDSAASSQNGPNVHESVQSDPSKDSSLATLVDEISSQPRNQDSIHPATGTLDDVLTAIETKQSPTPALTAEEWEEHWWPIREEMQENDRKRQTRINSQSKPLS